MSQNGRFPELTIGDVARRAGVATSSIRYYESIGLLPEPDRAGRPAALRRGRCSASSGSSASPRAPASSSREIKELDRRRRRPDGMGGQMRTLSSQKLDEVEALLERTKAMKGWLEVAQAVRLRNPAECALFPPRRHVRGADRVLTIVHVQGKDCRRPRTGLSSPASSPASVSA